MVRRRYESKTRRKFDLRKHTAESEPDKVRRHRIVERFSRLVGSQRRYGFYFAHCNMNLILTM